MATTKSPGKINDFYDKSNCFLQAAIAFDERQSYSQALANYMAAAEYLLSAHQFETNEERKTLLSERTSSVLNRCEALKSILNNSLVMTNEPAATAKVPEKAPPTTTPDTPATTSSSWFVKEKPNVQWSDVIGLEKGKQVFLETFDIPLRFPDLFQGNRKPWTATLLAGPPGTGKTMLVKALATDLDVAAFFSVKSSDIVSKYHGDSERLINQLFDEARQLATKEHPVVIFIDEIDALCAERPSSGGGDSAQASNARMVTEFLQQLDGFASINTHVFTVAATNLPWRLDDAILRRFPKHLYIPLPTIKEREQILRKCLEKNAHELSDDDFNRLAECTPYYSGADLSTVVADALMCPIRDLVHATRFFKHPKSNKWMPMLELHSTIQKYGQVEIKAMTYNDLTNDDLDSGLPVTLNHMLSAIEERKAVSTQDKVAEFEKWFRINTTNNNMGGGGSLSPPNLLL